MPQAKRLHRLVGRRQGGAKLLVRLLRLYVSDSRPLAAALRIACKCAASPAMQQQLVKEKGCSSVLLSIAAAHSRDANIVGPAVDLMVLVGRQPKGASQLAGDALVALVKDLLVNFLGNWPVFGGVLKVVKTTAKHEAAAATLLRANGEVLRLLLGVARLLVRLPDQRKLLK
ncbi:uncharacterized protein HaLaN_06888, partial [Haematococcus lacustris]